MKFSIPAETFVRMANAAARPTDDKRPELAVIRLEYYDGKYFCIASTSWVIAVEYMGPTKEPNAFVNVPIDGGLLDIPYGDIIEFDYWSDFALLTCTNRPLLALQAVKIDIPLFNRWYEIFPAVLQRVDHGFLFVQAEYFQRLADASPSGKLCFPEVIDNRRVTIIRDKEDPNWIGAFLPTDNEEKAKPATRPEWLP
jgi:hypothetical protein